MKIKVLFILLFCIGTLSHAQQRQYTNNQPNNKEKKWIIDVMPGANIDLIGSRSAAESKLMGSRPDVVPALSGRVTWLFSDKIGGYARLQSNFYKSKKAAYNPANSSFGDAVEAVFDGIFSPISRLYPSIDAGIIYRLELNRWKFHPGIGVGYMTYLPDHKSSKRISENNSTLEISYKQQASPLFLNMGLSTRYSISYMSSLVLDINFQQPLQKSSAELITKNDGIETKREKYSTSTAGRNLNISIGYGISF